MSIKKEKIPVIIITGPTAVGKTRISINIARHLGSEIINADSLQVYKYMDIGTAKPSKKDQMEVKHHLVDILEPNEEFNSGLFSAYSKKVASDHFKNNISPLISGGTGLYIERFLEGSGCQIKTDLSARESVKKELADYGLAYLYDHLKKIDNEYAVKIKPGDCQRIQRAIEVYRMTGMPFSSFQCNLGHEPRYYTKYFIINIQRDLLYKKIDKRVDQMIGEGFIDEVMSILNKGFCEELKAMKSIGYRQIADYLNGRIQYDNAITLIKQKTRNYAKRQLTWFRKVPYAKWINITDEDHEEEAARKILDQL